ncbi:MAG: bacteriohemerythrin [Nitrospirae bacterium]|nr:MAG: bacteriohemerythrin [Nitrospirota bacterium]
MPFMEWNDALSIKVEEIDEQHKILFKHINNLYEAALSDTETQTVGDALSSMVNYTVYHFYTEEEFMQGHAYQGYEEHKKEHLELTEKTIHFFERFQNGETEICDELLLFLKSWLTNHIMITDKKLAAVKVS